MLVRYLILAALLLCQLSARPQGVAPCPTQGIRTDPAAPANAENPGRLNAFNWFAPYAVQPPYAGGADYYRINWSPGPESILPSPYRQWDNSNITHLSGMPDRPADGWELVAQGLGYDHQGQPSPAQGTNVPYIILYNRFTGVLRVFATVGQRPTDSGYSVVTLQFANGAGLPYKSGLLNRVDAPAAALLDAPAGAGSYQATGRYLNSFGKWFVAEFPLDYDPCTCLFDSRLSVSVGFIPTGRLDVERVGPSGPWVWALNQGSASPAFDESAIGGLPTFAFPTPNGLPAASVFYQLRTPWALPGLLRNGLPALQQLTQDAALVQRRTQALAQLRTLLVDQASFLRSGLVQASIVPAAVDGLDFAVVGGRTDNDRSSQLPVMAAQTGAYTAGGYTAARPLRTAYFATPGSRYASTVSTTEEYPYYNETLGIFALLRRPVVERSLQVLTINNRPVLRYRLRVREPLAYALNPAANLVVQDLQVALEIEGQTYPVALPAGDFTAYDAPLLHPDAPATHLIRTAYQAGGCLPDQVFTLDVPAECSSAAFQPGNVSLKILLNLRRTDTAATAATQNVLLVNRYPATVEPVAALPASSSATPVMCSTPLLPLPASALNAFCASSAYHEAMRLNRTAPAAGIAPTEPPKFSLFPNPVVKGQPVRVEIPATGCFALRIYDTAGRLVAQPLPEARYATGRFILPTITQYLATGSYICVATLDGQRMRSWRLTVQ